MTTRVLAGGGWLGIYELVRFSVAYKCLRLSLLPVNRQWEAIGKQTAGMAIIASGNRGFRRAPVRVEPADVRAGLLGPFWTQ
jgi:hypothetical protein